MNYIDRYKDRKQYYNTDKGIFFDLALNYLLYGASINDYFMYRFYDLTSQEKKTFITCKKHRLIQKIANKNGDTGCFSDKGKFNTLFSQYIKRDWLDIDNASEADISSFLSNHNTLFLKDKTGCEGKGVIRFDKSTYTANQLKIMGGVTF